MDILRLIQILRHSNQPGDTGFYWSFCYVRSRLPRVIDISHYQTITNWQSIRNAGVVAIIHKATDGRSGRDQQYPARRAKANSLGFLWGSYARYAAQPFGIPNLWPSFTLWQFTDGNAGQEPHKVPGIGLCDNDTYNGS